MYYQDPFTWWTRLRPEDLPDLLEAGGAYCRIGDTALTIASFITPGLSAVKARIVGGPAASGASSALNQLRLAEDLTRQEASSGSFARRIAGAGSSTSLRDAPRLANTYGGNPNDYSKMVGRSHNLPDGTQVQFHWYRNVLTGEIVEMKPVYNYPH